MQTDSLEELQSACPDGMDAAEWRLRLELAACYRVFDALGWTELVFNHITVRVPGPETTYLINPFGLNYHEVTAHNLIRIGLDGTALEPTDHPVNRAGFVIHSAVHAARDEAHCVMHTHTTDGMAVACSRDGLQFDDFYAAQLWGDVAYHDFEGITVHDDEGPRLVRSLGDKNILILRNHGLLVVGGDVFAAFRRMWTLQRACEVQAATGALHRPVIPLTDQIRQSCAADARAFEPQGTIERMMFFSVLRRARFDPSTLIAGNA